VLESIITRFGYLGVLLGTWLEGEATVLAAGALAHKGLLKLPWVCLAGLAGALLSNQMWFFIGRKYGHSFLAKRPKLAAQSQRLDHWLQRFGPLFVISTRFLYGLRVVSVVWLGSSGFPYARFALLDTLGAVLWTGTLTAFGWSLGATLKLMLGRPGHAHELLVVGGALAIVFLVVRHFRRANPKAFG
jgi:membrane protein DedA with SNARE-associated domain